MKIGRTQALHATYSANKSPRETKIQKKTLAKAANLIKADVKEYLQHQGLQDPAQHLPPVTRTIELTTVPTGFATNPQEKAVEALSSKGIHSMIFLNYSVERKGTKWLLHIEYNANTISSLQTKRNWNNYKKQLMAQLG